MMFTPQETTAAASVSSGVQTSPVPAGFRLLRLLGPAASLRCVVFHDVSDGHSPFLRGLGVSIAPGAFEQALIYFRRYYTPVALEQLIEAGTEGLPPRPLLVTFDDAYASVAETAMPLCRKYGIPVAFFISSAFLDNRRIALANLACYVANVFGMDVINRAARDAGGVWARPVRNPGQLSARFLCSAPQESRQAFADALLRLAGAGEGDLARASGLYLSSEQVRDLARSGVEIGNHTYSHAHCRSLSPADFAGEIDSNKERLEAASGAKVRAFSVPYGSPKDLTADLARHLRLSGHSAVFLSQNAANPLRAHPHRLDRVGTRGGSERRLFCEIELLPRLRAVRNRWLR